MCRRSGAGSGPRLPAADDLGNTTYLSALNDAARNQGVARELYLASNDALIRIQQASRPGVLPEYDRALLTRELMLFPEWYVAKHLGVNPDG